MINSLSSVFNKELCLWNSYIILSYERFLNIPKCRLEYVLILWSFFLHGLVFLGRAGTCDSCFVPRNRDDCKMILKQNMF